MGQRDVGERLRAARLARGWRLDDVAVALAQLESELGEPSSRVDLNQVSKWERGARRPGRHYQPRLCVVFEAMPADLGFAESPRLLRDIGELRRRRLSTTGAGEFERLTAAVRHLWPADASLVDALERSLRDLSGRTDAGPGGGVLPDLLAYLDAVHGLLTRRSHPGELTARMLLLGSRAAQHASFLSDGGGQVREAYSLSAEAERMARESGNPNRLAEVFIDRAEQLSRHAVGPHQLREPIALAEAARLTMADDAPAGLTGWVLGQLSSDRAAQGDDLASGRLLDEAYTVTAGRDDLNLFSEYESAWLESYRGRRSLHLQLPDAVEVNEAVLHGTDPRLTWEHTRALYRLAWALALASEVEQAADVLRLAVVKTSGYGDRRGLQAAIRVRDQHLARWRTAPAVRRLDEAIRAAR